MSSKKKNLDDQLSDISSSEEIILNKALQKDNKKQKKKETKPKIESSDDDSDKEEKNKTLLSKKTKREEKPKENSKENSKKKLKEKSKEKPKKESSDSDSESELEIKPKKKKTTHDSDDEEKKEKPNKESKKESKTTKKNSESENSSSDEEQLKNAKKNNKKLQKEKEEKKESSDSDSESSSPKINPKKKELKKEKKNSSSENSDSESNSEKEKKTEKEKNNNEEKNSNEENEEPKLVKNPEKKSYSSGTWPELFVNNLSYKTTDESLKKYFSKYGEVELTKIVIDKETGRPKGVGFCKFVNPESASKALKDNDKLYLDGRPIAVSYSNDKKGNAKIKKSNFKGDNNYQGEKFSIFIGNLSFKTNEDGIHNLFEDCGKIIDIRIAKTPEGKLRGFAHVDFDSKEGLENALGKNGYKLDGRELRIDKTTNKPSNTKKVFGQNSYNKNGNIGKVSKSQKIEVSDDDDDD